MSGDGSKMSDIKDEKWYVDMKDAFSKLNKEHKEKIDKQSENDKKSYENAKYIVIFVFLALGLIYFKYIIYIVEVALLSIAVLGILCGVKSNKKFYYKYSLLMFVLFIIVACLDVGFFKNNTNTVLKNQDSKIESKKDNIVKLYYDNGNLKYEGSMVNGLRNGYGKSYLDSKILDYEGNWLDDKRNGFGKSYYISGSDMKYENGFWIGKVSYAGEWKDDLPNGKGIAYKEDGTLLHDGDFKDGQTVGRVEKEAEETVVDLPKDENKIDEKALKDMRFSLDYLIKSRKGFIVSIEPRFKQDDWSGVKVVLDDTWYYLQDYQKERFVETTQIIIENIIQNSGVVDSDSSVSVYYYDLGDKKLASEKLFGGYEILR